MRVYSQLLILLFILVSFQIEAIAQTKWYYSSSLQMVGSNNQFGDKKQSYFFYNGFRIQTRQFSLSLNLPIVLNSNDQTPTELISRSGTDHMDGLSGMGLSNVGIGDLFLYSSLKILDESRLIPSLSIEGYVKIPTASSHLGIGSGEFDYQIAAGLRKFVNQFSFFAQFGYLFIGDVEGSQNLNPYTINLGVGYLFENFRHSILIAYDSYTTIIQGSESPQQIALGYNYKLNEDLFITGILSKGLNNATSNYSLSGGLNILL